jgi:hypothetical protein
VSKITNTKHVSQTLKSMLSLYYTFHLDKINLAKHNEEEKHK